MAEFSSVLARGFDNVNILACLHGSGVTRFQGDLFRGYCVVRKLVKWRVSDVFWRLMLFYSQCCGSLLSLLTTATSPPKAVYRDTSRPRVGGLPRLQVFIWQNATPAGRVTSSCKYKTEKVGVYVNRRVTPPWRTYPLRRVNPPPC